MMRSIACSRLGGVLCFVVENLLFHRSNAFSTVAPTPTITAIAVNDGMYAAKQLQGYMDRMGGNRCCEIGPTQYGRGLVATKNLHPGETIMRIPLSCALTVDASKDCTLLRDDVWAGHLAAKLVDEICGGSLGKPSLYVNALPPPPSTPARGDWSVHALEALDNTEILNEIQEAKEWRNRQCDDFVCGSFGGSTTMVSVTTTVEPQLFLDALDLVSSRTIRCGNKFMLVPFLDMANHASQDQGGGYYELEENPNGDVADHIVLRAGERGVAAGCEVCLDYGNRRNEEWLIYYGFLPERNLAEVVVLPDSNCTTITWSDVNTADEKLREECRKYLQASDTTLSDDVASLQQIKGMNDRDWKVEMALQYRIARKTLLTAVGGVKTASAFSSAFFNLIEEETMHK
jgi:hypothetical protein